MYSDDQCFRGIIVCWMCQETGLKEKGVASAYYRSIKKLRAEMGDVK